MTHSCEEWLLCQRFVLPTRGTWTGWRDGHTGTSCSSTKGSAKSCTQGGITPCHSSPYMLGLTSWKAALQKRTWGSLWTPSEQEPATWPCHKTKKANCAGLREEECSQQVTGGHLCPLLSTGEALPGVLHPLLGPQYMDTLEGDEERP